VHAALESKNDGCETRNSCNYLPISDRYVTITGRILFEEGLRHRAWGCCLQYAAKLQSNMALAKPEIVITQSLYDINMKFQRIRKVGPEET
jgi:hypothetical protein